MTNIREMTPSDLDSVLLLRRSWLSEGRKLPETSQLERDWFARYPENADAFALVALANGKLIAYLLCSWRGHPAMSGTAAEIDEIHVAVDYRCQGIGRKLVDQARRLLRDRVPDLTAIRSSVDKDDQVARAFWQSIGFEHHIVEYTDCLE